MLFRSNRNLMGEAAFEKRDHPTGGCHFAAGFYPFVDGCDGCMGIFLIFVSVRERNLLLWVYQPVFLGPAGDFFDC